MVMIWIAMIAGLMLFGGFTTTKYIFEQHKHTETTSMPGGSGTDESASYRYWHPGIPTPPPNRENRVEDVNLRYFNGQSVTDYVDVPLGESKRLFKIKYFEPKNPTMMFVHGYRAVSHQMSIQVIVKAYLFINVLKRNPINIISLDWTNMAQGNYLTNAGPNAKRVGEAVAVQFNELIELGLDLESFHIIGHSLGSHVAGYIARVLKNKYKKIVKRVTALDAVFPGFYPGCKDMQHISADDAEFVDVIHTDAGGFGAPYQTGTADFWPNGGKRIQPGCPRYVRRDVISKENLCSHFRSWMYYAESVKYPRAFAASPASSIEMFKQNHYPKKGMVYMGYICDRNATGHYFLVTYRNEPFGKGIRGVYP